MTRGAGSPMDTQKVKLYLVRFIIAVAVLALGVVIFGYLAATRPEPKMVPRENLGELVEVIEVTPGTQQVRVDANGQVVPAKQVALSAEVGGRVVWLSKKLIPGARFTAGEQIARIDPREYNLALQQQFAQVDRAQTELELERSRKQIAEREWQLMGGGEDAGALALRDPQLRTAEAALKAARSGLNRARLSVAKTVLRAPFNAVVHQKSVDQGQLVGPASPVATLVGTDAFWVEVSIPMDHLSWIRVPGVDGETEGSPAVIAQPLGDNQIRRQGEVIRLMPNLDPMGRMARVLVEIPDPLGLGDDSSEADSSAGEDLPLLIGSYVAIAIDGRQLDHVIELPREAVRGGNTVFVAGKDNTLDIRDVDIVWRRPDSVLVGSGLEAGDRVIVSPLGAPVHGMPLRIASSDGSAATRRDDSGAAPVDDTSSAARQQDPKPGARKVAKPSR